MDAWTRRFIALVAVLVLVGTAVAQKPLDGRKKMREMPPDGYSGTAKKKLTDTVHLEYDWTFKAIEGDALLEVARCEKRCEGKKHAKHDQCDKSCDKDCRILTHATQVEAELTEVSANSDSPPRTPYGQILNSAYERFGLPNLLTGEYVFGGDPSYIFRTDILEDIWTYFVQLEHWNDTPCSSSVMVVTAKQFYVSLNWQLYDDEKQADGTTKRVQGPKGSLRFKLLIPVFEKPRVAGTSINCRCEVVQTPPQHGMLPGYGPWAPEYAYVEQGGVKAPATGAMIKQYISSIIVHDMTKATINVNAMPPGTLHIPAGWEMDCEMGAGQDVQMCSDLNIQALALPYSLQVNISPQAQQSPVTLRLACLEITKPEPDEDMKYRLVPPQSVAISRLAKLVKESRFRGPWDQMRLWIATDEAPFEKISKTMIPSPGEGTYVREMYKADRVGAISTQNPAIQKIMDAKFLFAEMMDADAVEWFAEERAEFDPDGTSRAIKGSRAAIESMFAKGDVKDDLNAIGAIAGGLGESEKAPSIDAATWLLGQGVPQAHREAVNSGPSAARLAMKLMTTSDDKTATSLIDWIEQSKPVNRHMALLNPNPNLSPAIQERIKKALQADPPPARKAPGFWARLFLNYPA